MTAQPRYGRLALLCAATGVTLVSVLGGMGALPSSADDGRDGAAARRPGPLRSRGGTDPERGRGDDRGAAVDGGAAGRRVAGR